MDRRRFLELAAAMPALAFGRLRRSQLTIIADEAADSIDGWIAFAKQYRLEWLEMRAMRQDGASRMMDSVPAQELKPIAKRLSDAGIRVSFLNSTLLKYELPGTAAVRREEFYDNLHARQGLTPEILYRTRNDRLRRALEAAHALGTTKLRTFSFWRIDDPRKIFPRLVDVIGEMGRIAESEGGEILVETEMSTNIATTGEIRDLLAKLPSKAIGINWDPQNSLSLEPDVFPAGYERLPQKRIRNVQLKAEGLVGDKPIDWAGIFARMGRDGYDGLFGLETHHGRGPENYRMSHICMKRMLRLAGEDA